MAVKHISMDQQRYVPSHFRPFGTGALFDYAAAMTTLFDGTLKSRHASAGRRKPAPQPEQRAERRWDGEEGSTQTRERRRRVRL